ncbi:hypothetical protein ESB00_05320 [Oleiharenicola lentus]|jgi:hypothetical protein|uniref:Uncharacterized protein n=1 Tax=Oleiharenicola lentus TaxID=2508720 RepID=A0A4V1M6G5_9BACT|nr:hypothetical protein [Oleiharenicola lentus]RXK55319.1 hypothetical protein ESB00_05320 [Oleiharenicola lentus]
MLPRNALLAAALCVAVVSSAQNRVEEEETAVYSKVFNNYVRTPSALGGFKPERIAFANGGPVLGRIRDRSVDNATFKQVVHLLSPALTRQNYVAAANPEDTDLLIYVYWGATDGYGVSSLLSDGTMQQAADMNGDWYGASSLMDEANRRRDSANFSNAGLLGYREALAHHHGLRAWGVHGTVYGDLVADVEEPRYFVIMTAFDFKAAWKEKRLVPLWSTRYNIASQGNNFIAALPDMSMFASRYFGRDSNGLIRRLNPTGKVDMKDVQILGAVETPAE